MTAWEKEVKKLDLHRALLDHDLEVMILTHYNSFFCRKLEITINAIIYNISIYRTIKPVYLKQVSHLLLPLDETLF